MKEKLFRIYQLLIGWILRPYYAIKYDVPVEIRDMWLAGLKQSEKISGTGRRKEVLMQYKDENGEYVEHAVGDVVPVIPLDNGKAVYYRIVDVDKPTFADFDPWDDGKRYDLCLHCVTEVKR